jgi:hypothetical protein
MSLAKKWGAEGNGAGERGGYYWLPIGSVHNFSGTNEFSVSIVMPPIPPGGPYNSAQALIITAGQYMLQGALPDYGKPVFRPSWQEYQSGILHNPTNSQCQWTGQKSYHALFSPSFDVLGVTVFRPRDIHSVYTGVLTWTLQIQVVGVLYRRGSIGWTYIYT